MKQTLQDVPVLVTGGTGLVGTALVPELLARGARVTVTTRDARRVRARLPAAVTAAEDVRALPEAPRAVVNLAGAGIADRPWTAARRRVLLASRVDGTAALREALAASPPEVLVSASAVGYYGTHAGPPETASFTEDDGPGEGFAADLCVRWEDEARAFEDLGTRVVRARIGLVLGPGGLLGRMRLPFSLGLGGRLGDGRQWMSWVHRDDVVALMIRGLEDAGLSGPMNLVAPEPVRNAEFTRALGAVLHRPTVLPAPAFVLRTLLGDLADELLLGGAHVSPARARDAGHAFRHTDVETAMAAALGRSGPDREG
jgi:uncharacterized protein (TIGR01777 family)